MANDGCGGLPPHFTTIIFYWIKFVQCIFYIEDIVNKYLLTYLLPSVANGRQYVASKISASVNGALRCQSCVGHFRFYLCQSLHLFPHNQNNCESLGTRQVLSRVRDHLSQKLLQACTHAGNVWPFSPCRISPKTWSLKGPVTPGSDHRTILKSAGRTRFFHLSCDRRIRFSGQIQNRIRLKKSVLVCDPVRKSMTIFEKSQDNVFDLRWSYDDPTMILRWSYDHRKTNHWRIF